MITEEREVLVDVQDLRVQFKVRGSRRPFVAVKDVSFQIYKGETFGLVGETGSGKTTIGRAIVRINETAGGNQVQGTEDKRDHTQGSRPYGDRRSNDLPRSMASLNERAKVDYIVSRVFTTPRTTKMKPSQGKGGEGPPGGRTPSRVRVPPHEFSGVRGSVSGRQGAHVEPEFIIADEPISSLDVHRGQVLNLLSALQKEKGLTYMFISTTCLWCVHCDKVAVIYRERLWASETSSSGTRYTRTPGLFYRPFLLDPRIERRKSTGVHPPSMITPKTSPGGWF